MTTSDRTMDGEGQLRFSFHEFLVDFLGGLVPGILFTVATAAVVVTSTRALIASAASPVDHPNLGNMIVGFLESSKDTPNMIWIGGFIFALLLSYVLGHIFYRRDPKNPDRESFNRLYKKRPSEKQLWRQLATSNMATVGSEERCKTAAEHHDGEESDEKRLQRVEEEWLRKNLACIDGDECEFPYPHLADYLDERGHEHLLSLVRWSTQSTWRTKTYINLLKIRLNFHHPDKYLRIIRNEAHVRLATSTWYLARALRWVSVIGLFLVGMGLFVAWCRFAFPTFWEGAAWVLPSLIAPVSVLSVAEYARISCEKFIHYQRLREVFYVLELAYTAFRDRPDLLESPTLESLSTESKS